MEKCVLTVLAHLQGFSKKRSLKTALHQIPDGQKRQKGLFDKECGLN